MKFYSFLIKTVLIGVSFFYSKALCAQKDSLKKRTVLITSVFKPVLKEAAKINFTASPPINEDNPSQLTYSIPNQNLVFPYEPATIKPLALTIPPFQSWDLNNSIKVGLGNLKTPYLQAGLSFGDGFSKGIQFFGNHISSVAKDNSQNYRESNIEISSFYKNKKEQEWKVSSDVRLNNYDFKNTSITGTAIQQHFLGWNTNIGFRNTKPTRFGLVYQPQLSVSIFSNLVGRKTNEQHFKLVTPLKKRVGESFEVNIVGSLEYINYEYLNFAAKTNALFSIAPSIHLKTPKLNLRVGIHPYWDKGTFELFPDITAEVSTADKRFVFTAGWVGVIKANSYQKLISQNQWLEEELYNILENTWKEERYVGFKGSAAEHFYYNAKVGFNKYHQLPLFLQDGWMPNPPLFYVIYEPNADVFEIKAEMGYTRQEKLSVRASVTSNQYSNFEINQKPFGLIPLELRTAFRLKIGDDVWFKSSCVGWKGAFYRKGLNEFDQQKGALDLQAGVEYRIVDKINLWVQCNNILNQEWQRWNSFPSYGFNFVAGVIVSFEKNKKQ